MNAWLAERLGAPSRLRFVVRHEPELIEDPDNSLADLPDRARSISSTSSRASWAAASPSSCAGFRHAYRMAHGGADNPCAAVDCRGVPCTARRVDRRGHWSALGHAAHHRAQTPDDQQSAARRRRLQAALGSHHRSRRRPEPAALRQGGPTRPHRRCLVEFEAALQQLVAVIDSAAQLDLTTAPAAARATLLIALGNRARAVAAFGFPDASSNGGPCHRTPENRRRPSSVRGRSSSTSPRVSPDRPPRA